VLASTDVSARVAIALGSSLGDRHRSLSLAVRRLSTTGMQLVRVSRWFRTPPLQGGTAKNWFLNGVALFSCDLSPEQVLERCVKIERSAGRRRGKYWADRPLDLDVLLYEDRIVRTDKLVLPHPAIAQRAFVLVPLLEVWPDATDPVSGRPYAAAPAPPGPRPAPDGILARSSRVRYL
jgi:2-amino-4-hydroxy-6-hydroxymethyldihydropteridine diphosphokinase